MVKDKALQCDTTSYGFFYAKPVYSRNDAGLDLLTNLASPTFPC